MIRTFLSSPLDAAKVGGAPGTVGLFVDMPGLEDVVGWLGPH